MSEKILLTEKTVHSNVRARHGVGLEGLKWTHVLIYSALCISLLVVLAQFDGSIANYFNNNGFNHRIQNGPIARFLKMPGEYGLTLITAIALLFLHKDNWRAMAMMLLSGLAGAINGVIKWVAGRARPFTWSDGPWDLHPFHQGIYGFFHQTNLSFTSGHTTQAFAWAEVLSIILPPVRPLVYLWALGTAWQRVASTDHFLTDAVAGAVLGVVTVRMTFRILAAIVPPARQEAAPADTDQFDGRPNRAELFVMPDTLLGVEGADTDRPYLSLVIPCFNEEENVPTLLQRVGDSMATLGKPFEVLIIDDGSTDKSPQLLAEGKARLPWLRILRMAKNVGQSAGFEAGFIAARGEYIATIDADLQNDPEEVPRLAKLLDENPGVDMITGWRKDRQDTDFRRWQSKQANKIRNWISQDNINDSASSLKIYRAHALKGLKLFNGAHRFFPALVKMRGYTVMETPVKHSQRFAGTAKYGFSNRAFRAFIDLLGVRWMKMRYLRYSCAENGIANGTAPAEIAQATDAAAP